MVCFGWSMAWAESPAGQGTTNRVVVSPPVFTVVPDHPPLELDEQATPNPEETPSENKAPKPRQMITVMPSVTIDLQMPKMVGIEGGSGYSKGTGLGGMGLGFGFDLFGGGSGSGNELIGTFYDLKQDPNGKLSDVGNALLEDKKNPTFSIASQTTQDLAMKVIDSFVGSGFNPRLLDDYFRAPKLKYAKTFMMPPINTGAAPEAFGVEYQVGGSLWICHYTGQIAASETGRYRFCGIGDDVLIVRIGRKIVLDACWPEHIGKMTSWESTDENSRKYPMNGYKYAAFSDDRWNEIYTEIKRDGAFKRSGKTFEEALSDAGISREKNSSEYMSAANRMVIGDWVDLKKGELVHFDVLIGELTGDEFSCRLLVEQAGKPYRMVQSDAGPRPVLPLFKVNDIHNSELIESMELDPNEMTLEGPIFGGAIQ
ncbi:MAG: hypothetical protein JXR40_07690 [Pontiellaceae bacterium]|nr:hypothetical protein [Pontiellaceae bacterium]